jgi:hypothetical protein
MSKTVAALAVAVAILALALLLPNGVNAGSSSSAPSKYRNASQQQAKQNFPITEYSSSARSQKH